VKELAPTPDTNDVCYCSTAQASTKVRHYDRLSNSVCSEPYLKCRPFIVLFDSEYLGLMSNKYNHQRVNATIF
jgi:hypothetical protein